VHADVFKIRGACADLKHFQQGFTKFLFKKITL